MRFWTAPEAKSWSAGGDYFLVRPDPQVIWRSEKKDPHWKKPDAHYHRSNRGGGDWEFFSLPKQWDISYALPESL